MSLYIPFLFKHILWKLLNLFNSKRNSLTKLTCIYYSSFSSNNSKHFANIVSLNSSRGHGTGGALQEGPAATPPQLGSFCPWEAGGHPRSSSAAAGGLHAQDRLHLGAEGVSSRAEAGAGAGARWGGGAWCWCAGAAQLNLCQVACGHGPQVQVPSFLLM